MKTPIETIYEFHEKRTACHISCVNYFAGLVGHHFPEHDNDKNIEPMRTGYAYKNYATYHPEYRLPSNYDELFRTAHDTHHNHASHHVEYYHGDVSRISDVCLIEMICDWFSANFEQVFILHDHEYESVTQWFDAKISHLGWTAIQLKTIGETVKLIERQLNHDDIMKLWLPITE